MTVPGVGPIVALAYIATLDNEKRFRKSIDVGLFLVCVLHGVWSEIVRSF